MEQIHTAWPELMLDTLTLEEKVGQLFISDIPGIYYPEKSPMAGRLAYLVQNLHIGGFRLIYSDVYGTARVLNTIQQMANVPLLISADIECGIGGLIKHPVTHFPGLSDDFPAYTHGGGTLTPPNMALAAAGLAETARSVARLIAEEGRALGIHQSYGPVLDVNINPDNPIINTRSFGSDPAMVAEFGAAYIDGLQSGGMIATAKHFPGHGDTSVDSHLDLPALHLSEERFNSVELLPFKTAIEAGVMSVMVAHIAFPEIDPSGLPATLSETIMTGLLREKLGYNGLIVTDGMTMQGITKYYTAGEAAVRAFLAGADQILISPNPDKAIQAVLDAVESGKISKTRLNESVLRILSLKEWLGLHKKRNIDIEAIDKTVAVEGHINTVRAAAEKSITIVKKGNIPFPGNHTAAIISFTTCDERKKYRKFTRCLAQTVNLPGNVISINPFNTGKFTQYTAAIEQADFVIALLDIGYQAFKGEIGIPTEFTGILRSVQQNKPVAGVSFGNPYIIRDLDFIDSFICAYSDSINAQEYAAKAITGAIEVSGALPVQW